MEILRRKLFSEENLFFLVLAALFGYSAGWLPVAFPLLLLAAAFLCLFKAGRSNNLTIFTPPGLLPLLLLAALPLAQLIPLPPLVLKTVFPGTGRLYGETIWLATPGTWMPVSLYPKATLNAFFASSLNVAVYLLTANLLREQRRVEKTVVALTIIVALVAVISVLLQTFPSFFAVAQVPVVLQVRPAGYSGISNLQALLTTLFPVLLLFFGYQLSLLRHLTLREKITEIFKRKSSGSSGLATTMVSLALLCIYIVFRFSPVFCAVSAVALIFCGLRLILNRRRRPLGRLAFIAAFFVSLVAILNGVPIESNRQKNSENMLQADMEHSLLSRVDTTLGMLKNFPILGTGLGTGSLVGHRLEVVEGDVTAREVIAYPANFVVSTGIAGTFLGVWLFVALLLWMVVRRKEPRNRSADCILTGSFAGLLAVVILAVLGSVPVAGSLWAFFLVGMVVAVSLPRGVLAGVEDITTGNSVRFLKASMVMIIFVAGPWILFALGIKGGKAWFPEAWQSRTEWQENNLEPVAAIRRARNAGLVDPLEDRYPFAQAELWVAAGNSSAAHRHFIAALRRDPLNGKYLQALGELLARDGDVVTGEKLIRAGLKDRSSLAERQEFYARWLVASARREEAILVMREGLARSPDQTRSFLQMMILEGIPLRDLRPALPGRSRCFLDFADYQRESGDLRGASENYQLALGLAIGEMDAEPSIFFRLYRFFSGDGNDEAALAALQAGLRLFPTNFELRSLSAETYQRLGLHLQAAEEYRKTLLTVPDNQKARQGQKGQH